MWWCNATPKESVVDDPVVDPACPICGGEVPRKGKTGPRKKYCSEVCRRKASAPTRRRWARDRNARKRAAIVKKCPVCGAEFSPEKTTRQMYCSKRCSTTATRDTRSRSCKDEGCDRPVRARGLCQMHYRREARADGTESLPEWDDRRRKNYTVRRARMKGASNADPSILRALIAQGPEDCPGCGNPIDLDRKWPDPWSKTIDHKIPVALGGEHVLENCQLMHLRCNASKGVNLSSAS